MLIARTVAMPMSLWRWCFVFALAAHGVAHAAGFAVSWRLMASPELPYHTTLFGGRLTVGDAVVRALGVLWLAVGAAFVGAAMLLAFRSPHAMTALAAATLGSLVLCLLEWPYARIGLLLNVAILFLLPVIASVSWQADSSALTARLEAEPGRAASTIGASAPLPPPVARYFQRSIFPGTRPIRVARIEQDAEFFVGGAWRPLTATQTFTVAPAGFVWDASIKMMPGMSVLVRDAYVNGGASMRADVMALYPIAHQSGRAELNAGALHRYLAEAVWLPTALRADAGVTWTALTDHSALATLQDGATRAASPLSSE